VRLMRHSQRKRRETARHTYGEWRHSSTLLLGETVETSASFAARYAPPSYPTADKPPTMQRNRARNPKCKNMKALCEWFSGLAKTTGYAAVLARILQCLPRYDRHYRGAHRTTGLDRSSRWGSDGSDNARRMRGYSDPTTSLARCSRRVPASA
jgi:hypothetical protein